MSRVSMFLPPCWLFCLCAAAAEGEPPAEPCKVETLTSGAPPFSDSFGGRLAMDGETLVVGALGDPNVGAAYVYQRIAGDWTFQQKLLPSQPGTVQQAFGFSVDIEGDVMVIGAPGVSVENATQIGEMYVFRRSAGVWNEEARILPSDSSEGDRFGYAVALSGQRIAVSAGQDPRYEEHTGWVYVFEWNGSSWVEQTRLVGLDSAAADRFGYALDLQGNTLFIGAPRHDSADPQDPDCNSGAVYVFGYTGSTWIEEDILTSADLGCHDAFGEAIAVDGTVMVVGASGNFGAAGSAYVFAESAGTWQEEALLQASDAEVPDHFGESVAVDGSWILIGAPDDDTAAGVNSGSAYWFVRDGSWWQQTYMFLPPGGGGYPRFAARILVAAGVIGIGAPAVGRAHLYSYMPALTCIPTTSTLGLVALVIGIVVAGGLLLRSRSPTGSTGGSFIKEERHDLPTVCTRDDRSCPPPRTPDFAAAHHPSRILVRFRPDADEAAKAQAHGRGGGIATARQYRLLRGLELIEVPPGHVRKVVEAYRQDPDVLYAEPDCQQAFQADLPTSS
jgi:hypothetical protein